MNYPVPPYHIFPLGDAAITIDFGHCIDEEINKEVIARYHQLQQEPLPGMIEAVPAYSSLTVFYDLAALKKKISPYQPVYEWMRKQLEERLHQTTLINQIPERQLHIPVCYDEEFGWDSGHLAAVKNMSVQDLIQIHTAKSYKVYMLGFLPGFAYMGEVDEQIAMPRKPQPVHVEAGSVGIAGKQTGIYPLASPGGWQIIGRTPLKLFNKGNAEPSLFRAGDLVSFYSIDKNQFNKIIATEAQQH